VVYCGQQADMTEGNREINVLHYDFAFWTEHFLKVNKKPRNALILQCIDARHSPACFGALKCHHQGVNNDLAEIGAQCCRNQ
jgi:hypothetical protein